MGKVSMKSRVREPYAWFCEKTEPSRAPLTRQNGSIGVIATQLLAMREWCRLSPETPVEEKVPKPWITLIERRL